MSEKARLRAWMASTQGYFVFLALMGPFGIACLVAPEHMTNPESHSRWAMQTTAEARIVGLLCTGVMCYMTWLEVRRHLRESRRR